MSEQQTANQKLHFAAGDRPKAQEALEELTKRHGNCPRDEADVIVALGGDGTLLEVLRQLMPNPVPVYGMNCGTVGFLMNEFHLDDLPQRIAEADTVNINPLRMTAQDIHGQSHNAMAINEVALLRQTHQTARVKIQVNGETRMEHLICDGVLLSTPAGSTAYNLSAHGPILPLMSNLLALTPISPFRPRRWRGALLPYQASVTFSVQDAAFRTVAATADNVEIRDVREVSVEIAQDVEMCILFDKGAGLAERIVEEQFQY